MSVSRRTAAAGLVAQAAGLTVLAAIAMSTPAKTHATTAKLLATVQGANKPLDAIPDPAGRTVYFTTDGPDGPAIFRVPAGGGKVTAVLKGAPLVHPDGLAVSGDSKRLFVADRGAGRILVVAVRGGQATTLRGSAGTSPRGLDVEPRSGSQRIVFTGTSAGRPAVLSLPANGAARPTVLAAGSPLRRPQAVAVAGSGAIYVSDRGSGSRLDGRVFKVVGDRATRLVDGIRLGDPAGIALTRDGSTLLVSSLAAAAGTAQVVLVNTKTLATSTFDDVIGKNRAAGGLHRGLRTSLMAWADVSRSGRVYRVDP